MVRTFQGWPAYLEIVASVSSPCKVSTVTVSYFSVGYLFLHGFSICPLPSFMLPSALPLFIIVKRSLFCVTLILLILLSHLEEISVLLSSLPPDPHLQLFFNEEIKLNVSSEKVPKCRTIS
jgi:hypothetical protein